CPAYTSTTIRGKEKATFRLNSSAGAIKENIVGDSISEKYTLVSINPYFQVDYPWMGIGIGASVGNNIWAIQSTVKQGTGFPESGLGKFPLLPIGHLRRGPKRFFALEYNFNNHEPFGMPVYTSEFSVGSGFGAKNDFHVRYGFIGGSIGGYDNPSFLSAYIPIKNTFIIEPTIGFNALQNVYMLNLSYRFGHKTIP
ncbi:MAG: hypothetical protein U5K79_10550, partial [Cyclobacteriaceae bacterium]|nr:hypothetical protein [Cyclobacteriaceae bacterium]